MQTWDPHVLGDSLTGSGSIALKKLDFFPNGTSTYGSEIQVPVALKFKNQVSSGRLLVFLKLEEFPVNDEKTLEIAEGFERGTISIKRICAFDLQDTEWIKGMTKQDPYVVVSLAGDSWTEKTAINTNAGRNSVWDSLDMTLEVDKKVCEDGKLNVTVRNKGHVEDVLIGSGDFSLRKAASKLEDLVEVTCPLKNSKGKPAGRVVLYTQLKKEIKDEDVLIDPKFTFGNFKITRILAFNLKNVELIGNQDPYVKLSLGAWTGKTHTINGAGDHASWEFLTFEMDMDRQTLESNIPLEVQVFDENQARSDALIGSGSATIKACGAQINKEIDLKVSLVDSKGKASGRLTLTCSLCPLEKEVELPASFEEGLLSVQRIVVSLHKKKGLFNWTGGKYSLRLSLNDSYHAETTAVSSAEDNPVWNYLDNKVPCDVKAVKTGQLKIEVISKAALTQHDSVVGVSMVDIRRAGSKLNSDVELIGSLEDKDGQTLGQVTVLARLVQGAALSKAVLDLPAGFTAGIITMTGFKAMGLVNKELMGKQVHFIDFMYLSF